MKAYYVRGMLTRKLNVTQQFIKAPIIRQKTGMVYVRVVAFYVGIITYGTITRAVALKPSCCTLLVHIV